MNKCYFNLSSIYPIIQPNMGWCLITYFMHRVSSVISKMGFVMSEMGFPKVVVPAAISCSVACSAVGFVYQVCLVYWRCFSLLHSVYCGDVAFWYEPWPWYFLEMFTSCFTACTLALTVFIQCLCSACITCHRCCTLLMNYGLEPVLSLGTVGTNTLC